MSNARKELLEAVKDTAKIKCASITYGRCENEGSKKVLKLNHTNDEYNEFTDRNLLFEAEFKSQVFF